MRPKSEEFLNVLLWSANMLTRPTFRNLTESYEGWAYRTGLYRQTAVLEEQNFIEADRTVPDDRVYRLTPKGRLHALGGRDPQSQWARPWDGQWRFVLFDVPVAQDSKRTRLRRYLRDKGFGCLQGSVWITPDRLEEERSILGDGKIDVTSLILLEARTCAGESDAEIVASAWDFADINRRYARHLKTLGERPQAELRNETAARELWSWAALERESWLDAARRDPMLPERLLPDGYLGRQAWRRRVAVLRRARQQIRGFEGF